jgi:hypothetical protein
MYEGKMYCCLSTTFSVSLKLDLKYQPCLGRMPSAVGYQPTLATEMGQLQERITSTKKGSITSIQAVYVPADDYTDPAPATSIRSFGCDNQLGTIINRTRNLSSRRSIGFNFFKRFST